MQNDELAALDARVNALLPPIYRGCYSTVSPSSMGSAKVKYGPDGKPAWDDVWTTFCDLALAGGPPHRGKLLEPPDAEHDPDRLREVVAELGRAVRLTSGLPAADAPPGWAAFVCETEAMAAWVQLAVVAENVSCRRRVQTLLVPVGSQFRVEKEIKNVTVALAKACHYWEGHLTGGQQRSAIRPPWEPACKATDEYRAAARAVADGLRQATGLPVVEPYTGWVGMETGGEDAAVWLLRAVVSDGVLCRREGGTVFLPVGATPDGAEAERVVKSFARAWRLWGTR